MKLSERDRGIYLDRLAGRAVQEIARERKLSRPMVHRIIARIRDSGAVMAKVGVSASTVEGPFTPQEIANAVRDYAKSLGVQAPTEEPR